MPYRYTSASSIGTCPSTDVENSTTLASRAKGIYGNNYEKKINNQISCKPHVYNAGNWYNFPAATAGSNNISTSTKKDMPNSICPKGWQLPDNAGTKSYNTLITTYGISTPASSDSALLANSAMSFVRLGYYLYTYGSLYDRGLGGVYWSSTASSSVDSHYLGFNSGYLGPQGGANRASGFSIRCVAR